MSYHASYIVADEMDSLLNSEVVPYELSQVKRHARLGEAGCWLRRLAGTSIVWYNDSISSVREGIDDMAILI